MPNSSPARVNWRVKARSSALGAGSPEGWVWKRTKAAALFNTAAFKMARGSAVGSEAAELA